MLRNIAPDKKAVEAVIAAFRDPAESLAERLAAVSYHDWERTYYWLDANDMALYFLNQIQTLGLENAIPDAVRKRLEQNLADNRMRTASMLAEFRSLNKAFLKAGLRYANIKGFTLAPESCPDPCLRCQLDFDFLIDGRQQDLAREVAAAAGYRLTSAKHNALEFKAGSSALIRIEDHYKPCEQRSLELHFIPVLSSLAGSTDAGDERLDRLTVKTWDGLEFPVLDPSDQLIGQALHVFGHVCSPNTRLAWFLEYKRHLEYRANDSFFLHDVELRAKAVPQASIAIGLTSLLSERLFGGEAPAQLNNWTLDRLPRRIRLWGETYATKAIVEEFRGTKLHLFLLEALGGGDRQPVKMRRKIFPLHFAPRVMHPAPGDTVWRRLRIEAAQILFNFSKARFHIVEGIRFLRESTRWKRLLSSLDREAMHASKACEKTPAQLKKSLL
jgi:hypothetical protein